MKLLLDCMPCLLRQVLEASRHATDDEQTHEEIMADAIRALENPSGHTSAPGLCQVMHRIVRDHTGDEDPYRALKDEDIAAARAALPHVRRYIDEAEDRLLATLKVAATGNVMDAALFGQVDIGQVLGRELALPFTRCDLDAFRADLDLAETVLVLGDNAGEAVFDTLLVAELAREHRVTYAARGGPILNDATVEDALAVGLGEHATVVSTGCRAPGTILSECTPEFLELFETADLVLSKGQGNYEAMSECERAVYFLLKAKCAKLGQDLDVTVYDYVFVRGGQASA